MLIKTNNLCFNRELKVSFLFFFSLSFFPFPTYFRICNSPWLKGNLSWMLLLLILSSLSLSTLRTCPLRRTDRCWGFLVNCRGLSRTLWSRLQLRWMPCRVIFNKRSRQPWSRSDWTSIWAQYVFWGVVRLGFLARIYLPWFQEPVFTNFEISFKPAWFWSQEAAVLFFLPCFGFCVCM